jgi:hypothetical protein
VEVMVFESIGECECECECECRESTQGSLRERRCSDNIITCVLCVCGEGAREGEGEGKGVECLCVRVCVCVCALPTVSKPSYTLPLDYYFPHLNFPI